MFRSTQAVWRSFLSSVAFRCRFPDTTRRRDRGVPPVSRQVEALEDRTLLAAPVDTKWQRVDPAGSLIYQREYEGDLLQTLYADDFESPALGPEWSTYSSTADGRVGVSDTLGSPVHSGSHHLAMDTSVIVNNLNEAILTVDLSGVTDAQLSFWHKDVNDEDTALPSVFAGHVLGDGVSISDDGATWHRLVSLNNANSPNNVYTEFNLDLSQAAASAGITLGSNFQIKFQQYDNFPFSTDGRTFDDVMIQGFSAAPDVTTVSLEDGQTLTVIATPDEPGTTLSADVYDTANNLLGSATAAAPGEAVDLQTLPIENDGDYRVEIRGDQSSEFQLSLFRNASVEVTDSGDGAEQDATGSFVSLGSGRWGIVGEFTPAEETVPPGIGLLANDSTDQAVIFDPATNTIMGSVQVGPGFVGDALVLEDGSLGFVTDFQRRLWAIDMSTASLVGGPISISNPGEDISVTADQRFLVVSDGSGIVPLSVVSTSSLTEVSTFLTGSDANSVEVGEDGSVLVTSVRSDNIRRLTIDGTGTITDTGERLNIPKPGNSVVAPGAEAGVVLSLSGAGMTSFTLSGLTPVNTRSLSGNAAYSAAFNSAGDRLYVRSRTGSAGFVDAFDFDPLTGTLSASPIWTISVQPPPSGNTPFGVDQIAVAPNGLIYVSEVTSLNVYDPDGNLVTSITDPTIRNATGVYISSGTTGPALRAPVSIENGAPVNPYGEPGEPGPLPTGPSAAAQHPLAGTELLVNGSFETGDFSGWTTVTTSSPFRPWAVTGAGQGDGFDMLQTSPQDGTFEAWNGFDGSGPMEYQMYQDVSIPAGNAATLSWLDRVQWNFTLGGTATQPRLYDVEVRDPNTNAILDTVYSFSTGTQAQNPTGNTNWQSHSADLSAYAGQTVRIFFREQIPESGTGPGQIEFDGISLVTDQAMGTEELYAGVGRGSAVNPGADSARRSEHRDGNARGRSHHAGRFNGAGFRQQRPALGFEHRRSRRQPRQPTRRNRSRQRSASFQRGDHL